MPTTNHTKNYWPKNWEKQTQVMAIINITEDSFSDGGLYIDINAAIKHASLCIKQGAKLLDLGAQSTRPGASIVGAEIEIKRLVPLIKELKLIHPDVYLSVDTFNHSVAENALIAGADWINDISGGRHDPYIFNVISEYGCPYVLTHSRGNSMTMDSLASYQNVVQDVKNELYNQVNLALLSDIKSNQIIVDPGLGFAKNTEQNLTLLRNIEELVSMEFPLLVGASRKRFIGSVVNENDPSKRIFGMAAIASRCVIAGVNFLRVHDVKEICQVVKMTNSIIN